MNNAWKTQLFRGLTALACVLTLANCSKSSGSDSGSTSATSTTGLYLVCSTTNYYVLNGSTVSCASGQTIYRGDAVAGMSLQCPTSGQYTFNAVNSTCTPYTTVTLQATSGTTGTTTCTTGINPYTGQACTIGTIISTGTTGTTTCTTGINPYNGQPCTIGTVISTGTTQICIGSNGLQYPCSGTTGGTTTYDICSQYYGPYYHEVIIGGQPYCERIY